MDWKSSINGFKSYLQLEKSLSENSVAAYVRAVTVRITLINPTHREKNLSVFFPIHSMDGLAPLVITKKPNNVKG